MADKLLRRPFRFYGGYVSLTSDQRTFFVENKIIDYYKCIIKDLSDSNIQ
jgi:hypothetical protein